MAQAKKKPAPKKKAAPKKRTGLAAAREQTLTMGGTAIARARKEMGMTRQRLAEALDFTSAQLARIEKGAAQLPFDKIGKAVKTLRIPKHEADFLKTTREKATRLSGTFSGQAKAAWKRLSETEAHKLTSDMLELGGHVPGAGVPPSVEELVLFAVRAAEDDERRFRRVLDAFGVELAVASKVITKALEDELTGKQNPAPGKKAPAKKGK
jgi:transcriptional regulator with XRE-family HTH domain